MVASSQCLGPMFILCAYFVNVSVKPRGQWKVCSACAFPDIGLNISCHYYYGLPWKPYFDASRSQRGMYQCNLSFGCSHLNLKLKLCFWRSKVFGSDSRRPSIAFREHIFPNEPCSEFFFFPSHTLLIEQRALSGYDNTHFESGEERVVQCIFTRHQRPGSTLAI